MYPVLTRLSPTDNNEEASDFPVRRSGIPQAQNSMSRIPPSGMVISQSQQSAAGNYSIAPWGMPTGQAAMFMGGGGGGMPRAMPMTPQLQPQQHGATLQQQQQYHHHLVSGPMSPAVLGNEPGSNSSMHREYLRK